MSWADFLFVARYFLSTGAVSKDCTKTEVELYLNQLPDREAPAEDQQLSTGPQLLPKSRQKALRCVLLTVQLNQIVREMVSLQGETCFEHACMNALLSRESVDERERSEPSIHQLDLVHHIGMVHYLSYTRSNVSRLHMSHIRLLLHHHR